MQIAQVLAIGVGGELRLPGFPVVGVVGVHLSQELFEAIGVTAGDHVGGDELTQSLEVLAVLGLGVGLSLSTGLLKLGDGQPLGQVGGACGLQVGQELGVDTVLAEDGVDDLLPVAPSGMPKAAPGLTCLESSSTGICAILYST